MGNDIAKNYTNEIKLYETNFDKFKKEGNLPMEISNKELMSIHKQILFEYPYLSNVYESMLVTDMRLDDNPIVFANDQFEYMTLYPKEEIVGRNCRFLQGELTDPKVVSKIKNCVVNGKSMDVEILNYRKDGVPFMNNFLVCNNDENEMLPVHKKGKTTGTVTHFIAIQKDVTVYHQKGTNPYSWSKQEVGMWLKSIDKISYCKTFITEDVDGKKLFSLTNEDLQDIGVVVSAHRKEILQQIDLLRKGEDIFEQLGTKQYSPPSSSALTDDNDDDEQLAEAKAIWNTEIDNSNKEYVVIKLYRNGISTVMKVKKNCNLKELQDAVEYYFSGVKLSLTVKDDDGDFIDLTTDEDLEGAILLANGNTLKVHATKLFQKCTSYSKKTLNKVPVATAVIDGDGDILMHNKAFKRLFKLQIKSATNNNNNTSNKNADDDSSSSDVVSELEQVDDKYLNILDFVKVKSLDYLLNAKRYQPIAAVAVISKKVESQCIITTAKDANKLTVLSISRYPILMQ